jgi:micrococcal nuclease
MAVNRNFASTLARKRLLLGTCLIVLVLCLLSALPQFSAKVVGVFEGDSLTVLHDDSPEVICLYGIDAPENSQPFSAEAERFATGMVAGKIVTVRVRGTDRFHQTIADVILPDGRMLAQEVVRNGFAWWDPKAAPDDKELQRLQTEAKAAKRGLWADPKPVPPWEWQNPVHVPASATSTEPAQVSSPNSSARPGGGQAGYAGGAGPGRRAGAYGPNNRPGNPNQPAANQPPQRGNRTNPNPNRRNQNPNQR